MKDLIKFLTRWLIHNNFSWLLLDLSILRFTRYADRERKSYINTNVQKIIESISPHKLVLEGPFKGMIYPDYKSLGSTLPPKLLGSYEVELVEVWREIFQQTYTEILDIGCAEGYYAIGLARYFIAAQVYAYDINPTALSSCKAMAVLNNVSERLSTFGECTMETIRTFPFTKRGLIVCDCEGYEDILFTPDTVGVLQNCDLVIELHPFLVPGIDNKLFELFSATHKVKLIASIPDIAKPKTFPYASLMHIESFWQYWLLTEKRSAQTYWLYAQTPK